MCVVCVSVSQIPVNVDSHNYSFVELHKVHLKEWDRQEPCAGMCEVKAYLTDTHTEEDKCISLYKQLNATNTTEVIRCQTSLAFLIRENQHTHIHANQTSLLEILHS